MIQSQIIYCGDNLTKLRDLPDECVDLIYIDPPFNSNRNYEVFWGDNKEKRSFDDRFGAVEHYIHWMRPRIMELWRVLKKTGSFYYHCDTHANAYVRVMLDQVFGINQFQSEIIWKRTNARSTTGQFPRIHDTLFLYSKSSKFTFHAQAIKADVRTMPHTLITGPDGEKYQTYELTAPGATKDGDSGKPWRGFDPAKYGRHWANNAERMDEWDAQGLIHWPANSGFPRRLAAEPFVAEDRTVTLGSVWTDIDRLNQTAKERLGYPTQKPVALLNRIVATSSNKGDLVLDAFCGCGTTLESAQTNGRRWIGIDVSPTSCRVMAQRLKDRCFLKEGTDFWVRDLPKTAEELRKYPPFEFENWAVNALNTVIAGGQAIANRAQVGDMGIDGRIYPATQVKEKRAGYDLFGETDRWFPVQVKQKDKAGRPDIDSFETAMQRQGRDKGFFISFDFTSDALQEIKRVAREMNLEIIPITVKEILDEEVHYRV